MTDTVFNWDFEIGQLPLARTAMQRHPKYSAAVKRLATGLLLDLAPGSPLRSLLRDAGHNVAAACALYLDATGSITQPRFRKVMARFGIVSAGRARALLQHMLHIGLVEISGDPNARPMQFRASERFIAAYQQHQASILAALAFIEPNIGSLVAVLGEREVFDHLITESADAFAQGSLTDVGYPLLYDVFLHRRGGIQIMHDLVARADSFPPSAPIAFSTSGTASRCAVTQMHVSRIKKDGIGAGLFTIAHGALTFTDLGQETLNWYYASRLCLNLRAALRTVFQVQAYMTL